MEVAFEVNNYLRQRQAWGPCERLGLDWTLEKLGAAMDLNSELLVPTYTPKVHFYIAIVLVTLSMVLFYFGVQPSSLEGSRSANVLGWFLGSICAPVLTLTFRQTDNQRSVEGAYIPNLQMRKTMTALLIVSIMFSILHSFFWALERSF